MGNKKLCMFATVLVLPTSRICLIQSHASYLVALLILIKIDRVYLKPNDPKHYQLPIISHFGEHFSVCKIELLDNLKSKKAFCTV